MITVHIAVVLAPDGVRLVAASASYAALLVQLADYVAERAPWQLWPRDAALVAVALGRGDREGAVARYFDTVGQRWDEERLHTSAIAQAAAVA